MPEHSMPMCEFNLVIFCPAVWRLPYFTMHCFYFDFLGKQVYSFDDSSMILAKFKYFWEFRLTIACWQCFYTFVLADVFVLFATSPTIHTSHMYKCKVRSYFSELNNYAPSVILSINFFSLHHSKHWQSSHISLMAAGHWSISLVVQEQAP